MKKTIFALAAIAFLTFTACDKDNDNSSPNQNQLLGKWTHVSTKEKVTDTKNNTFTEEDLDVYDGDYMEFRDNGKVYTRFSNPNEGPGYDPHDTLSYTYKDNTLTIDEDEMTVSEFTGKTLIFTLEEKDGDDLWQTTYSFTK